MYQLVQISTFTKFTRIKRPPLKSILAITAIFLLVRFPIVITADWTSFGFIIRLGVPPNKQKHSAFKKRGVFLLLVNPISSEILWNQDCIDDMNNAILTVDIDFNNLCVVNHYTLSGTDFDSFTTNRLSLV